MKRRNIPRAQRAPVPWNPRDWEAEYNGIRRFLASKPHFDDMLANVYYDSMKAYYEERIAYLIKKKPRGARLE